MFNAKIAQNPTNEFEFTLTFEGITKESNAALRVQLVDADKFFMPCYSSYCVEPVTAADKTSLQVTFSLPQILERCGATNLNSRTLEFSLINGKADEFVCIESEFKDFVVKTALVSYRLCLGKGKNLILRLEWALPLVAGQMKLQDDHMVVQLAAKRKGSLILRHRIEHDIVSYDWEKSYQPQQPNIYQIPYQDLLSQTKTDWDLFCLYYRCPATATTPSFYYRVVTQDDTTKLQYGKYLIAACKVRDKTASIAVYRAWQKAPVSKVKHDQNQLTFSFTDLKPSALKLYRIMTLPTDDPTVTRSLVQPDACVLPGAVLPLTNWENIHQNIPLEYRLVAEADGADYRLISEQPYEKTFKLAHQTVTVTGNSEGFFLRITETPKKVRLGIMGTCMTRWAFSGKYTNAYQGVYDVAFAHFWPSVFSLMEDPIPYPKKTYAGYAEREIPFVRREYEKTSLRELKDAKCEYVLIDFFVDAIHGPRKMPDGKFIGYKAYANDFYQDYLMFDSEKYFLESNDYFEEWTKAADKLIDELKTIVPQNRIVLATGGLTHNFLSEDGKIECFDGLTLRNSFMTKHSINALNYLWDKMNTYFMAKLPGAHILSMREYQFLAHDRNPANVRPYHFQNSYYRAMSAELSRIILWDKQNQ